MILRDYQLQAIERIRQAYRETVVVDAKSGATEKVKRVLYVLPTAGGKTTIFTDLAARLAAQQKRIFILAHRNEICEQIAKSVQDFGLDYSMIRAGQPHDDSKLVHVCSTLTLNGRFGAIKQPDFIIGDEGHHFCAKSYGKIFEMYPHVPMLFVTATAQRLDGRGLGRACGGFADRLIEGPTVAELMEQGYLAKARYYGVPPADRPDFSKLKVVMGDFAQPGLVEAMTKRVITGSITGHYGKLIYPKPALCFVVNLEHGRMMEAAFNECGFRAKLIEGVMGHGERADIIAGLGDGRWHVVLTCQLVEEGVNVPIVTGCIIAAPTLSIAKARQRMGRVLRPYPGKEYAIIVDHVGQYELTGFAETPITWTLDGRKPSARKNDPQIRASLCPKCFSSFPTGPDKCPWCGAEIERTRELPRTVMGNLIELKPVAPTKEQKAAATWAEAFPEDTAEIVEYNRALLNRIAKERNKETGNGEWAAIGRGYGPENQFADYVMEARKASGVTGRIRDDETIKAWKGEAPSIHWDFKKLFAWSQRCGSAKPYYWATKVLEAREEKELREKNNQPVPKDIATKEQPCLPFVDAQPRLLGIAESPRTG